MRRLNQRTKEKLTAAAVLLLIVLGIGYVGHDDYQVRVLEREAHLYH